MSTITTNNNNTNSSSLLFSIEQWELVRRLRNSGLNKDQLCQAYDDLERIERDLTNIQQTTTSTTTSNNNNKNNNNSNIHYLLAKTLVSINNNNNKLNKCININSENTNNNNESSSSQMNLLIVDTKELDEFRKNKSEHLIHNEISQFVYKYDLKQSQIARMAGVNQAYVSKFLRGDFGDLSENGKTLIYKWYLKLSKNPLILLKQHQQQQQQNQIQQSQNSNNNNNNNNNNILTNNINHNNNNNNNNNGNGFSLIQQLINNTCEQQQQPKRTRFSFKLDHLKILEKAFNENPYPDPKKREELAKQCNEITNKIETTNSNNDLISIMKVTEQIVTHWFQNKRKLNRKLNNSNNRLNNGNSDDSTTITNDDSIDMDEVDEEKDDEDDDELYYNHHKQQQEQIQVQQAAYKAIMSRVSNKE